VFPETILELRITLPPAQNVVGPFAEIVGADGVGLAEITIEAIGETQPFTSVTNNVNVPAFETFIDDVVAPVLQVFPVVTFEVKFAVWPVHNAVCEAVITGIAGNGFCVTTTDAEVAEQPTFPTVTEYVPAFSTVIDWVVAPLLQTFPEVALEVKITLSPTQKVVGSLGEIVGVVGLEFTVTICDAEEETQPFASVNVKV
jgi:hypothetical protein